VNFVEKMTLFYDGFATSWLIDGSKITDGGGKFASVDEFTIGRGGDNMLLVFKFSTPEDAMEFKIVEGSALFGGTRSMSWRDRR
jgi:hypothetical protein